MQIFIQMFRGQSNHYCIVLEVERNTLIKDVLKQIYEKRREHEEATLQTFIERSILVMFGGTILDKEKTLEDYGIGAESFKISYTVNMGLLRSIFYQEIVAKFGRENVRALQDRRDGNYVPEELDLWKAYNGSTMKFIYEEEREQKLLRQQLLNTTKLLMLRLYSFSYTLPLELTQYILSLVFPKHSDFIDKASSLFFEKIQLRSNPSLPAPLTEKPVLELLSNIESIDFNAKERFKSDMSVQQIHQYRFAKTKFLSIQPAIEQLLVSLKQLPNCVDASEFNEKLLDQGMQIEWLTQVKTSIQILMKQYPGLTFVNEDIFDAQAFEGLIDSIDHHLNSDNHLRITNNYHEQFIRYQAIYQQIQIIIQLTLALKTMIVREFSWYYLDYVESPVLIPTSINQSVTPSLPSSNDSVLNSEPTTSLGNPLESADHLGAQTETKDDNLRSVPKVNINPLLLTSKVTPKLEAHNEVIIQTRKGLTPEPDHVSQNNNSNARILDQASEVVSEVYTFSVLSSSKIDKTALSSHKIISDSTHSPVLNNCQQELEVDGEALDSTTKSEDERNEHLSLTQLSQIISQYQSTSFLPDRLFGLNRSGTIRGLNILYHDKLRNGVNSISKEEIRKAIQTDKYASRRLTLFNHGIGANQTSTDNVIQQLRTRFHQ